MLKKFSILLLFCGGLALLEACVCGDDTPFFDFDAISLFNDVSSPQGADTSLNIAVYPASIRFLAAALELPFGATALYATSCPDPGRNGLKNPVVDVEITAAEPFNDTLPAGSSLKPLFKWVYQDTSFQAFPVTPLVFEYAGIFPLVLRTTAKPQDLTQPYHFKVTLIQQDGREISATSGPVTFQ